jgi:hypothetical protein
VVLRDVSDVQHSVWISAKQLERELGVTVSSSWENWGMANEVRKQVEQALSDAAAYAWLGPEGKPDPSTIPREELLVGLTSAVRDLMEVVRLLADEIEFR